MSKCHVVQIKDLCMEKSVGIIKEIDSLGRIVIPKEVRERLLLEKRVELVLTEQGLLIRNEMYDLVRREEK